MGILPGSKTEQKTPASKRRSTQLDFSNLGPLKKEGTVGFSAFRDQETEARRRRKSQSKSNGGVAGGGMDEDSDDDADEDDFDMDPMDQDLEGLPSEPDDTDAVDQELGSGEGDEYRLVGWSRRPDEGRRARRAGGRPPPRRATREAEVRAVRRARWKAASPGRCRRARPPGSPG